MAFTSLQLEQGKLYTRRELQQKFDTLDATINTGIFRPSGSNSVWLFVTEKKPSDKTPYVDRLQGDTLHWQGQMKGRKDPLIIEHRERGLELLLFYREDKKQHPDSGFRYEGKFAYVSHSGSNPTNFVLKRVAEGRDYEGS